MKQELLAKLYEDTGTKWAMKKIQRIEKEVEVLLYREECYWWQQSRAEWLLGGDKNKKYFHHKASNRRGKNEIMCIQDKFGNWIKEEKDILKVLEDYFSEMFLSMRPSNQALEEATKHIDARLLAEEVQVLERSFTKMEFFWLLV